LPRETPKAFPTITTTPTAAELLARLQVLRAEFLLAVTTSTGRRTFADPIEQLGDLIHDLELEQAD
jgi:hypothetical protein